MTLQVEDRNFDAEVLKHNGYVLVDFWAEWCGPCKQIAPIVDEISKEKGDKLKVAKVNIENSPETPGKYGVRGIPTLMIFKDGSLVSQKVGSMPKAKLTEWVDSVVQ
jgi:thioredoxin 1